MGAKAMRALHEITPASDNGELWNFEKFALAVDAL